MSDALILWSHARINPRGIDIDAYISHIILVPLNFGMYSIAADLGASVALQYGSTVDQT